MQVIEMGNLAQAHAKEDPNLGLVPDTSLPESGLLIEGTAEELQALGPVIFRDVIVTAKDENVDYKSVARIFCSHGFDVYKLAKAVEEVIAEQQDGAPAGVYRTPAAIVTALKKEGLA